MGMPDGIYHRFYTSSAELCQWPSVAMLSQGLFSFSWEKIHIMELLPICHAVH